MAKYMMILTALLGWLHTSVPAQTANYGERGPFLVSERELTFTDSGLASPTVKMKVYHPATASGQSQPVAAGVFPGLAFGHGFNLGYTDYDTVCYHLASWGFIVMSPDVQNGFSVNHLEFARELAACLKQLKTLGNDQQSIFYGKVDTMTGVLGHSMGGGASGLVPGVFPEIDAVSGLSAADTDPSAIAALASYSGPFQAISGSQDNVTPEATNQIPMYQATTGYKHHLSITGGAHCKYTDASTICDLVSGGGSITRDQQIALSTKYATAFFQYFLKQDLNALPFLCGDSLLADAQAQLVTYATNIVCAVSVDELEYARPMPCPNPATDMLTIEAKGDVILTGIDGRIHFQKSYLVPQKTNLDVSRLPRGFYMLRVEGNKPVGIILH